MSSPGLGARAWRLTAAALLGGGWLLAVPVAAGPALAAGATAVAAEADVSPSPQATTPEPATASASEPASTETSFAATSSPETAAASGTSSAPEASAPQSATEPTQADAVGGTANASTDPTAAAGSAATSAATSSATPSRTRVTPRASASATARAVGGTTTTRTGNTGSSGSTGSTGAGTGTGAGVGASGLGSATPATGPTGPSGPAGPSAAPTGVTIDLGGLTDKPSTPVLVILGMTLMSLAPALLLTCTSFTKILVVLGLTRNALGLQQTPPNQVLVGLALFLSLFVMGPVLGQIRDQGVQPYLDGTKTASQAFEDGIDPLRTFMLAHTDDDELALLTDVAHQELPASREDVPTTTLVPAFVLSELKEAFTIGFMIFVPFLVIDMVVSGGLMALGMMMMPPVMVSLPFKLLLFVMVDGWGLVIKSLVSSYGGG